MKICSAYNDGIPPTEETTLNYLKCMSDILKVTKEFYEAHLDSEKIDVYKKTAEFCSQESAEKKIEQVRDLKTVLETLLENKSKLMSNLIKYRQRIPNSVLLA